MPFPIIDLHCDLLMYLAAGHERSPLDAEACCSLPQLKEGNVKTQVFALFTETREGSTTIGEKQFKLFSTLKNINAIPSIENGSIFAEEEEPLERGLKRLDSLIQRAGKFAYVSLTWNDENRFGGGNSSNNVGLKPDGKILLEKLADNNIPIDLSHTSDQLAYDILRFIDNKKLSLPVLASHSNSRTVCNHPRNLPDDIAKEIFRREGVVGLNFVLHILGGSTYEDIFKHYSHFVKIGGNNRICFGADFFCPNDLPESLKKLHTSWFSPLWPNSACYPPLLNHWLNHDFITKAEAESLANGSARRFFLEKTQITDI